jgi:hypothetical protein
MNRFTFWSLLVASFILPALFALLAIGACGVGHGDCRLMVGFPALFPFAYIAVTLFPNSALLLFGLALSQFPLYVLLLRKAAEKSRLRPTAVALVVAHALAAALAYVFMF